MDANYIRVFDNCLDEDFCNYCIDFFENNPELYDTQDKSSQTFHTLLTQINITRNLQLEECQYIQNKLIEVGRLIVQDYIDNMPSPLMIRYTDLWEFFRIKRYLPNGEEGFGLHADNIRIKSAPRWLAFFWYLNDVDEGGRTIFSYDGENEIGAIEAKRGRCLVFPPLWTYPHIGEKPISGNKYIIGSYLHYWSSDEVRDAYGISKEEWTQ